MKRKTYGNVMKAIKIIQKKGYDFQEASEIVLKIFDEHENDVKGIEFFLNMVISKEEFQEQFN